MVRLYETLLRLMIEYCLQEWNPNKEKDKILLKIVQRRTNKMIQWLGKKNDEERIEDRTYNVRGK